MRDLETPNAFLKFLILPKKHNVISKSILKLALLRVVRRDRVRNGKKRI